MVLIESAEPEDLHANPLKPSSTVRPDSSDTKSNNFDKDAASDGFETASDGDIDTDDDDTVNAASKQLQQEPRETQKQEQQEKEVVSKGDSCENKEDAEELKKEKAMAQANDAKLEGNKLFVDGQYEEALLKYELALQVAPEMDSTVEIRSICHSNRAICFLKLGKYEDTVKECTKSLELNPTYMKSLIRRVEAHEKLQHYEEAIADLKKILELDPSNDQARKSIHRLEPLAEEKREKMKEEMIGKLKEMGNSLLGRFGMSVDNFKAVKDPNTGSYSISFQQ